MKEKNTKDLDSVAEKWLEVMTRTRKYYTWKLVLLVLGNRTSFFKDFKKLRGRNEAEFIRWRCFEKFPISGRKFSWENELK